MVFMSSHVLCLRKTGCEVMKEAFVNYFCDSTYSFLELVFFPLVPPFSFLLNPGHHEPYHLEGDACLDERLALSRSFLLCRLLTFQK